MPGSEKAHGNPPTLTVVTPDNRSGRDTSASFGQAAPFIPNYPEEVTLLLHLLDQLPPDVSPQTGAQIIRVTLQNMGTPTGGASIATVLRQAQMTQSESLNAVRRHLSEIESHQERIRQLEAALQQCQQQANQLSNLIDLFLLAETSHSTVVQN